MTDRNCESDNKSYLSNPPQSKCKHCGQMWLEHEKVPVCKTNPITKQLEEWKNEVLEKAYYDPAEWDHEWSLDDVIESVEILVSRSNLDLLNTIERDVEVMKKEQLYEDYNNGKGCREVPEIAGFNVALNQVLQLLKDKLKQQ